MMDTFQSGPLDVGDLVEDFSLDSQVGKIDFLDMIEGKWCLLVTFASAFDPVTTTDLGMLSKMAMEFESRNIVVLTVGNDSVPNYRKWVKDIEELQTVKVNVPMLCDPDCAVLKSYGCAKEFLDISAAGGGAGGGRMKPTCLGAFLIDIDRRIRTSMRYGMTAGRNFYELVRLFDALQLSTHHKVVCPSNWGHGQEVVLSNDVTQEEAARYRYTEIKPWFRLTECPDV